MRSLIGVLLFALTINSWAADEADRVYIYGTYLYCDTSMEEAADKTFEDHFKPAYEKNMKDGDISGWGYLKHHTGGKWRRLLYHMGSSVPALLDASDKQSDMIDKTLDNKDDHLGKACTAHDDYIWESKAGNVSSQRGKVGLSVYFVCDMNSESRADELASDFFGPMYDKHLKKGGLTSWGWLSHVIGGQYRRVLTMTAANYDDLFATRAELLSGFAGTSAAREFNAICGSHTDYLWDIGMEGRKN